MGQVATMAETSSRLKSDVDRERLLWRLNYTAAVLLFVAALASSGLGTVFAATAAHGKLLPWLTAAPGIMVVANGFFKFGEKYEWHSEKSSKLYAVFKKLQYGGGEADKAVDDWNRIDEEMRPTFPRFGEFSIFPGKRSTE